MDKLKLSNVLKKFEEHLIIDKGLGRKTVQGYCRSLSISLKRMRRYVPKYEHIKDHMLWMHKKEYSYSHITNTSLAIEHYTAFKGEPVKLGRQKKPKRILKDFLSESEISRIIAVAPDVRRKCVASLLAYSGIRNQEFCNIKVEDLNLGANEIRVLGGKNSKDYIVNISSECANLLFSYLQTYPRPKDAYLFTTLKRGNQLSGGDLRKILKVLTLKAGIERRVYPHLFRHSLASNLLKRGASILMIKEQLGHAFIETSMIYVHSINMRAKSEYEHFKPAYA